MHTVIRTGCVLAIALLIAACTGGTGSGSGITISDAWSRSAARTAGAGAAYMVIGNTGSAADALVGCRSDIAKAVEVHETYEIPSEAPMESTGMGNGMGTGMMGMRRIDRLEIPAGGTVELRPGGYHIMLIDLTRELRAGDTIEITLTFEKAGDVKVTAEVRAQ